MKTKLLILLSLFISSVCFGVSGKVTIMYTEKHKLIIGKILSNVVDGEFQLKTNSLHFARIFDSDNSIELNDLETLLSAICREEFSKDKFSKLLFKNANFTSDLDKSAILFSSVFRFLEEFMIKSNFQITQGKEDRDSALMTNTFYFYKPD